MENMALPRFNPSFPLAEQVVAVPAAPYAVVKSKTGNGFDLDAAADEFYTEFPEQKGKVFIVGAVRHTNKNPVMEKEFYSTEDCELYRDINELINHIHKRDYACAQYMKVDENKPHMDAIAIATNLTDTTDFLANEKLKKYPSIKALATELYKSEAQRQQEVSDHELGHALCSPGTPWHTIKKQAWKNHAECQADAYAIIRHYQRYGTDSTLPETLSEFRAVIAIHGDIEHYTSRAIEKVIELNKKGEIAHLTPHQSRDLAIKIAEETALSLDEAHSLNKIAVKAPFDELLYHSCFSSRFAMCSLSENCRKTAKTKSPAVHALVRKYLDITEKYQIFDKSEIKKAKGIMAQSRPDKTEPNRPLLSRLRHDFECWKKYDMSEKEHAALKNSKPSAQKPPGL